MPYRQPEIIAYSKHIADSFRHWTGRSLTSPSPLAGEGGVGGSRIITNVDVVARTPHPNPPPQGGRELAAFSLYHAPFVLVSHGTQTDPIFCYANLAAQTLWNMSWETFTQLPSRLSAEPDAREERQRLLLLAEKQGFVDNYSGVRVTSDGRRFAIRDCILWNVLGDNGEKIGQAAAFQQWDWL